MHRFLLAAFLFAAAPAYGAQAAPTPASVDAEAFTVARELLLSLDFTKQVKETARRADQATFETMIATVEEEHGTTIPPEFREKLRGILTAHGEGLLKEIEVTALDDAARVYARYFTADELRELRRLQSNPVLAKSQRIAPQMSAELMQIGVSESLRAMPALKQAIESAVREWLEDEAKFDAKAEG